MIHALAVSLFVAAVTPANSSASTAAKLAQVIANSVGASEATVYVGALPPNMHSPAPLPKYLLLGSLVNSSDFSSLLNGTVLFYEIPAGGNALDAYRKQLTAAHWTQAKFFSDISQSTQAPGGFDVERVRFPRMDVYCGPGTGIVAMRQTRGSVHGLAISYVNSAAARTMCATAGLLNAIPSPPPPAPVPNLKAPTGITMQAERDTEQGAVQQLFGNTRASISGALPLGDIGGAFAKEFTTAGWSADAPAQSATVYAQTFQITAQKHRYRATLLLVAAGAPQTYDASIEAKDLDAKDTGDGGFSFPFP